MVGFPTETRDEARTTLQAILDHRDSIQEISARVFYLDERSEIFQRRAEFDIAEIYPDAGADLQVYYDFKCTSGMSRREAREVYLEFTRALRSHFPVFQNTNMLYHELKSHYFLYLAKHGSWERLVEQVLERPRDSERELQARPRRRDGLARRELRFDRASIDARMASIDSHTLRPRYQSDLVEDDDRARFDRELEHEQPSNSVLVYDRRTGEVQSFTTAAALLLERCDGTRTLEQIVEIIPAPHRREAARCVEQLASAGLLETPTLESVR
jgi:hypothetical protein